MSTRNITVLMRAAGAAMSLAVVGSVLAADTFVVDVTQRRQTMDGFGFAAAGAWNPTIVGVFQNPAFAAQLATDLKPAIVRVQLPPSFSVAEDLDTDTIDWSKYNLSSLEPAATVVRNLHLADPSLKVFMTIWSPPAWMKTNGSTVDGHLRTDRLPHLGKYCAAACLSYASITGVPLYSFSVQNEPLFENGFDSCAYTPTQFRDAVLALDAAWTKFGVTTGLMVAENHAYFPSWVLDFSSAVAGSAAKSRVNVQGIHGYTPNPAPGSPNQSSLVGWQAMAPQFLAFGFPRTWLTEASGQSPTWVGPLGGADGGGIQLARDVHHAIVGGQMSAYVHWLVTTDVTSEYSLMTSYTPNPKYHAFRHFCRYVRPGMVRCEVTPPAGEPAEPTTLISSYLDEAGKTIVVNAINASGAARSIDLNLTHPTGWTLQRIERVRSSSSELSSVLSDLTPGAGITGDVASISAPAYSITTLRAVYSACYANCDGSTTSPVLGAADFVCFLGKFRAGDPAANCDGSTSAPILGAADFVCFLNQFRAGCP